MDWSDTDRSEFLRGTAPEQVDVVNQFMNGGIELLARHLLMRRGGGVQNQRLGVAHIREMRPERDAANEVLARLSSSLAVEGEHGARSFVQVLVDEWSIAAALEAGAAGPDLPDDPIDPGYPPERPVF